MIVHKQEMSTEIVDENTERTLLPYSEHLMGARIHFKHKTKSVSLHHHVEEQLTLVLKGRLKFFIEDTEQVVEEGDSLFFESNMPHGCIVLEDDSEVLDIFTPMRKDFL